MTSWILDIIIIYFLGDSANLLDAAATGAMEVFLFPSDHELFII